MHYLQKHENMLIPNIKKRSELLDSNNLINFTMSDENLNNLVKVNELKEKLLVGMIPREKAQEIQITSFVNNVQKPFNAPTVVSFSELKNKLFLLLYHVYYLKEIEQ